MQYRHLGRAGIQVSELSFGSWVTFSNQVDVKAAADCSNSTCLKWLWKFASDWT
jgi:aryl-alcohol dehydrogenase-like predicted oxidoreductase